MEALLDDLISGTRTKDIFFSFYQESFNVNSRDFSTLLSHISQEFSVDIESIEYYFSSESNLLDVNDEIDPE